jgi:hypothetical protein
VVGVGEVDVKVEVGRRKKRRKEGRPKQGEDDEEVRGDCNYPMRTRPLEGVEVKASGANPFRGSEFWSLFELVD